ncbi:MAG: Glu-tRNA(Gln) amidotransferase subunit GatD [Thermoplasmata archaeon]
MSDPSNDDPWEVLRGLPRGREVEIHLADGHVWKGTLVPSHELSGDRVVQIKVASGYNVGVRVARDARVVVLPEQNRSTAHAPSNDIPAAHEGVGAMSGWVALLTTGGTIASRVDYRTGGVRPVKDEAEILAFYPDLGRDGPVRILPVFDRLSEEIDPVDWATLAEKVVESFAHGARGVVVAHGTDTLAYTAAALSFLLADLPGPVVVVGAQRSPDRPSSDGPSNLAAAVRLARHPALAEVVVLMHEGLSDDRFAIHRATRVRKMHSSRRDAFRTRNGPPLGVLDGETLTFASDLRPRSPGPARIRGKLDPRVGLLWVYPGARPDQAERFVRDLRGVVLAGTGLGHVSSIHLPWIREAVARGTIVAMTTQCLEGSADPYVYATGRELLRAGVLYLGDILPEVAYVKMLWALGQSDDAGEVRRLLQLDHAGEMERRHPPEDAS